MSGVCLTTRALGLTDALCRRTLVIDEADKAPVEVVAVLKGLVEDGEMALADGRLIVSPSRMSQATLE